MNRECTSCDHLVSPVLSTDSTDNGDSNRSSACNASSNTSTTVHNRADNFGTKRGKRSSQEEDEDYV